jgi:hypothetical protein
MDLHALRGNDRKIPSWVEQSRRFAPGSLAYKLSRRQKLSPVGEWWNMNFGNTTESFVVWSHPLEEP